MGGIPVKYKIVAVSILTAVLMIVAVSCADEVDFSWISDAELYQDEAGTIPTDTYEWLDPFYLIVTMDNPPAGTEIQASWIAVDTNRAEPNTVIKIDKKEAAGNTVFFELINEGSFWPVGLYQVNIYLNGELYREIEFDVISGDIT